VTARIIWFANAKGAAASGKARWKIKTIKIPSRNVATLLDRKTQGFLFTSYEIGTSVEGFVRTVHGYESEAQRVRPLVPLVLLGQLAMAAVEAEWTDGIKVEVIDGIYERYVGFIRVRAID